MVWRTFSDRGGPQRGLFVGKRWRLHATNTAQTVYTRYNSRDLDTGQILDQLLDPATANTGFLTIQTGRKWSDRCPPRTTFCFDFVEFWFEMWIVSIHRFTRSEMLFEQTVRMFSDGSGFYRMLNFAWGVNFYMTILIQIRLSPVSTVRKKALLIDVLCSSKWARKKCLCCCF